MTTTTILADVLEDAAQGNVSESDLANVEAWLAAYRQAPTPITKDRVDYYGLPAAMFSKLPPMPGDFKAIKALFEQNRWVKPVPPEYYGQPEWYPTFESIGVRVIKNVSTSRFGGNGYMVYPSDSVLYMHPGDSMLRQFWVRSGFVVITYQGMSWAPVYPASAKLLGVYSLADGSRTVAQDPVLASTYFTVEITPNEYVLPPDFPMFAANATVEMQINVTVHPGTPVGNYAIGIDTVPVSAGAEQAWTETYLTRYTSGGMINADRPKYLIFVSVIK